MTQRTYTDEEIDIFIESAKDVGLSRAMRELGYPGSWATAKRWVDARGIKIDIDALKAAAAEAREWYKDEEVIRVAEAGMERIYEQLTENETLTPDDVKRLSEGYQKFSNQWMAMKGKTQTISETRSVGETDMAIKDLIAAEQARNALLENGDDAELSK